jgi:hypothetical protein
VFRALEARSNSRRGEFPQRLPRLVNLMIDGLGFDWRLAPGHEDLGRRRPVLRFAYKLSEYWLRDVRFPCPFFRGTRRCFYGNRNGQVVQRYEGVRVHHP